MHWKIVPFFRSQLKKISKIYRFIDRDFEEFQQVCHLALGVDIGRGIYNSDVKIRASLRGNGEVFALS